MRRGSRGGQAGGAGGPTKSGAVLSVGVSLAKAAAAGLQDPESEVRGGVGMFAQPLRISGVSKAP